MAPGRAAHGSSVHVGLINEHGYPHAARLDFVDNQVDPDHGTIRARAVLDNVDEQFMPGLFVRLKLVSARSFQAALVDDRAIGTDLGRKFVFVVDQQNVVQYRSVVTGRSIEGLRVVKSGLDVGRCRDRQRFAARSSRRARERDASRDGSRLARRPRAPRGREQRQPSPSAQRALKERTVGFSQFFVRRPIFAAVLSAIIFIAGALSLQLLPISEYPEVVPPTVVVRATYPGANPQVIAETVAAPLEQAINGVERMLYTSSQSTADGLMTLTVTFSLGTDLDKAQVQVQNRVSQTLPKLPEVTQRLGVTTEKATPDLTMVVHLVSPDQRYDMLYLANYATLNVRDELARIEGVGEARVFGAGDYAMRVWLDPDKVAALSLTASDVVRKIREQNVQIAAGQLGAPPAPNAADFQLLIDTQGRLVTEEEFQDIVVKIGDHGQITRLRDIARVELGASTYALRSLLDGEPAAAIPIYQRPGSNAIQISDEVRATMERLAKDFPQGIDYEIVYDPTMFVRQSIDAVVHTLVRSAAVGRARGVAVPTDLARVRDSARGRAGVARRHARRDAPVRLLAERVVVVRPRARDRHRRRRCDRRGRKRRAQHRTRAGAGRSRATSDARGDEPDHRDGARADSGIRADGIHQRSFGPVLSAVRVDHRDQHGDLGVQLADAVACARGGAAQAARRAARPLAAGDRRRVRLGAAAVQSALRVVVAALRRRRRQFAAPLRPRARRLRRPVVPDMARLLERARGLHPAAGQAVPRRVRAAA